MKDNKVKIFSFIVFIYILVFLLIFNFKEFETQNKINENNMLVEIRKKQINILNEKIEKLNLIKKELKSLKVSNQVEDNDTNTISSNLEFEKIQNLLNEKTKNLKNLNIKLSNEKIKKTQKIVVETRSS
jgi:hypothetical protein